MIKASDELEMIVCGAHIAGCLEQSKEIDTSTDMELMEFLVKVYNEYCTNYELENGFAEYVEQRLLEEFAV